MFFNVFVKQNQNDFSYAKTKAGILASSVSYIQHVTVVRVVDVCRAGIREPCARVLLNLELNGSQRNIEIPEFQEFHLLSWS